MAVNRWGLIPDAPNGKDWDIRDHFDLQSSLSQAAPIGRPNRVAYMKNQRQHGACTAFMRERLQRMAKVKAGQLDIDLSPLHAYYWNRVYSGLSPTIDSGAGIRGSIDAGRAKGICRESWWTYANADGYLNVKPEPYADEDAEQHQILESYTVPNNPDLIIAALAAGFGVGLGSAVHYNAYEMNFINSGDIQMPQNNDQIVGYHAYVLDGWNTTTVRYDIAGSWGEVSPQKGFGTIPFDYITKFGFDIWVVKTNESPTPEPANHTGSIEFMDGHVQRFEGAKVITVDNKQVFP